MSIQSVNRAVGLLRLIAMGDAQGLRLVDLVMRSDLTKGTVHRILATLVEEGLVEIESRTKRYRLGVGIYALGAAASNRYDLQRLGKPSLRVIADATEDVGYLWVRDGPDAVCLDYAEGTHPIRVITLGIGYRRPLGVGAGSLVLLAGLADEEIETILARDTARRAAYPNFVERSTLLRLVRTTRASGYSFVAGMVINGMSAIGVPVVDHRGSTVAALSVAAISDRLKSSRRADVVKLLQVQAKELAVRLSPNRPPAKAGSIHRRRAAPKPVN